MFLSTRNAGYRYAYGEQFHSGKFLLIFCSNPYKWAEETGRHYSEAPDTRKLYATVRQVTLAQLGCWMMGKARIGDATLTVSGAYGADGLPMDLETVPPKMRPTLVELPPDLQTAFWKQGGWNDAGGEAPAMREWAKKTFGIKATA
jgi:hypothetical protein